MKVRRICRVGGSRFPFPLPRVAGTKWPLTWGLALRIIGIRSLTKSKKAKAWASEIQRHEELENFDSDHCIHLRRKLSRLPFRKVAPELLPPRPLEDDWTTALASAISQLNKETDRKLKDWKISMQDSIQCGSKKVFDWLRHGAQSISLVLHEGVYYVHPPNILSVLKTFWEPTFCPDDHALDPSTIRAAIALLEPVPLVLPSLSSADFFRAAQHRSTSSAGVDGIDLSEIKALPEEAWGPIVHMVDLIESGQPWPWQLLEGDGVGISESSKVRLVSISSHVYRSWSWIRCKQSSSWLASVSRAEIHGGIQGRGTFDVVTVAANQWQLAQACDKELGQLLLDSSKCFDTLFHDALLEIGTGLGLPDSVSVPFRSFVSCHVRILALRGWVGPSIYPKRGLPQGDSLSVLYAVIWAIALRNMVRRVVPSDEVTLAIYLDDISFSSASPALLLRCFAAAQCFLDLWKVLLNVNKTVLLLSARAKENWPTVFGDICPTDSSKLLGVEIGPVLTGSVLVERLEQCLVRLDRIRLPPCPLHLKRKLVASYVCPLLYGVSYSVVPSDLWQKVGDVIHSICYGSSRLLASKHLVLAAVHGAHNWRPDGWAVLEMARVIYKACSRPAGPEFVAEALRVAQADESSSSPLWLSWISWVRSFGGIIVDGNITLKGKVVLHHGLSLPAWKHEVRRLLSLSAIALAQKSGRHLQDLELEKWDCYMAHHVIVPSAESHGTETFSSGGLTVVNALLEAQALVLVPVKSRGATWRTLLLIGLFSALLCLCSDQGLAGLRTTLTGCYSKDTFAHTLVTGRFQARGSEISLVRRTQWWTLTFS
eukprot:5207550-Amphidinium_carterae.2